MPLIDTITGTAYNLNYQLMERAMTDLDQHIIRLANECRGMPAPNLTSDEIDALLRFIQSPIDPALDGSAS